MEKALDALALVVSLALFVLLSPLFFWALLNGECYCGIEARKIRVDHWNCTYRVKRNWMRLPVNTRTGDKYGYDE